MYFSEAKSLNPKNSFTLVELLIVIAIIAILGAATIFVINPTELLKKTRDTVRISDLKNLDLALQMAELEGLDLGNPNVVYISLPDSNSNCSSYSLPSLPSGWSYHCASEADYRKVDGNGWIPVDFTALSSGAPFSSLPVDPINDENHYYMYFAGGSYELNTWFESQKYAKQMSQDGGDNPCLYEKGSNLSLGIEPGLVAYWKLDEGEGTMAKDSSGNNNDGTLKNGPQWVEGKVGMALEFDGNDDYVDCGTPLNSPQSWSYEVFFKPFDIPDGAEGLVGESNNPRLQWGAHWSGIPKVAGFLYDSTAGKGKTLYSNEIEINCWHHVVMVVNTIQKRMDLYVDTNRYTLTWDETFNPNKPDATHYLNYRDGYKLFYGIIDEVRIYNRALAEEEIKRHYWVLK